MNVKINIKKQKRVKVISLSDLHGNLIDNVDKCDIVTISGDIVPLRIQADSFASLEWFFNVFCKWALSLPCKHVVFIGGNHDFFLEDLYMSFNPFTGTNGIFYMDDIIDFVSNLFEIEQEKEILEKITYLCDTSIELCGLKIYGTPWCANLSRWAFYNTDKLLKEKYESIPDCDILLTHEPPFVNECGMVHQRGKIRSDYGNKILYEALREKNIRYAVCGHTHTGCHKKKEFDGTTYVNASILDENYRVMYQPVKHIMNVCDQDK